MGIEETREPEHVPVPGVCKICRGASVSDFYGVSACRVCKGIFKRGVKKKFHCLFDNACNVRAKLAERCKACVFAKCVRKGMIAPSITAPAAPPPPITGKAEKSKPTKPQKKSKPDVVEAVPTAKPAAIPVDRYYEVKEDLKSLFEPSTAKPFRFFDSADAGGDVDEFQAPLSFDKNKPVSSRGGYFCEEDDDFDQVLPSTVSGGAQSTGQTFFFTDNDPRLEEGMRWMSLDEAEKAASLVEWKKNRPQIFADFKKLKKDANRKRKSFDRR